ncbi:hypothetical protein K1X84_03365 [bacterium]|nr:hypothetical protein [bacterium]
MRDQTNLIKEDKKMIDIIFILFKRKKIIITSMILIMSVTGIVTLLMNKWFESKAVILLPEKTSNPLEMLTGNLGIGASILGGAALQTSRYIAILNSRRLREAVINQFDLMGVYDSKNMEDALVELEKNFSVENDKKNGTILISILYANDPEKAAEITNYAVVELDEINRELSTEQARFSRVFIEQRYNSAKKDLRNAEDSLNVFQNKFGVIALTEQTKVGIEAAAKLQAEIVLIETEYNVKKKTLGENHPDIIRLESQLVELKKSKNQMEYGGIDLSVFIPFKNTPDLGLRYFRLYREVQINSKILELLVPQYEQAKIQEAKDTPTLLVLDKAVAADYPVKPKKKIVVVVAGFLTFLMFVFLAFNNESIKVLLQKEDPKYQNLKILIKKTGVDRFVL